MCALILLLLIISPEEKHVTYLKGRIPSKAWVIVGGLANANPLHSRAEWFL